MIETRKTLSDFIREHEIRVSRHQTPANPNVDSGDWGKGASHWHCVLSAHRHDRTMALYFSQGSAHRKPPSISDLLECLAADAATVENSRSFDDWAADLGFDTDSRKAERSYRQCVKQSEELREFLGQDDYEELLWRVERD